MSGPRTTHTYVTMEVSPAAYTEIRSKLLAAGYNHAVTDVLDMHGIALTMAPRPTPVIHRYNLDEPEELEMGKD